MKIIFCGWMYSEVEDEISNSVKPHPVSGHKFQDNLCRGLMENDCDLTVVNSPRVRRYPNYGKLILKRHPFRIDGKKTGVEIGQINLFGINYISQFINTFRELRKAVNIYDEAVLMTFNSYVPQSMAMIWLKRIRPKVIICDVIGDLHGKFGCKNRSKGVKNVLLNLYEEFQDKLAAKFDCYVFLSDYMKEAFDMAGKMYVVVEGFSPWDSEDEKCLDHKKPEGRMIFYAGALQQDYGILHLLKAFSLIKDPGYELVLAGDGDSVAAIKDYAAKDSRIKYVGLITPARVKEYQRRAVCLVSPRLPNERFVKYSFPSKTMECLASGVPYVAHRLPCEPAEYGNYIQYPKGNKDADLAAELERVCEMNEEEWVGTGKRAKEFLTEHKSSKVQCKKILSMLKDF